MADYMKQLRRCVADLGLAVASNDLEEVRSLAHSMKGASKQIGATRVGDLLGAIEGQDETAESGALLEALADELPFLESAVNTLLRRSARAS